MASAFLFLSPPQTSFFVVYSSAPSTFRSSHCLVYFPLPFEYHKKKNTPHQADYLVYVPLSLSFLLQNSQIYSGIPSAVEASEFCVIISCCCWLKWLG